MRLLSRLTGASQPKNLTILCFLSGISIPTVMQAMGSPLAENRVSRLNGTIPAPPVLNISNIANTTLQLKPSESLLEDLTGLAGPGNVDPKDSAATSLLSNTMHNTAGPGLEPAVSKHHESGPGYDHRNNWLRSPVSPNYFYLEGSLYVRCPPAGPLVPEVIALINREPIPQFPGIKESAVRFNTARLRAELLPSEHYTPNQENIVSAHQSKCLKCACGDDGRIIRVDTGGKKRHRVRCPENQAVLCKEIWKCYCFATLYQPIYQGVPRGTQLKAFTDVLSRIPRSVYDHIHNSGWSWRAPADLAEFPEQRIDPGPGETRALEDSGEREGLLPEEPVDLDPGDLDLAGDLAGDLAENYEFSLNVAPSDEPPYYLSGPENEIPADDPGEGSSTGASRSYNSYAPDDPWFGWGYGYGYGFDYDGSNEFFPPNKRDLSIQDKITHNQES
ncbi:hypothetical protein TWF225_000825 [Orbilia oligospora]|nr:hypothetical protein TWF225_000825 [Orbilia oligospora]KAF3250362.1 hypothetical protein TWF128_007518 [Orbilia oligospora]KAF3263708.1 hypothetical protein TWF217_003422 [Orbilia oligospora]KAF3285766.1 hypothetical protein TWF132_009129 [Orbilia oligospora]